MNKRKQEEVEEAVAETKEKKMRPKKTILIPPISSSGLVKIEQKNNMSAMENEMVHLMALPVDHPVVVDIKTKSLKPAYDIRLINHVARAHFVRLGSRKWIEDFSFPVITDVLHGSYSEDGFACVTLRQRQPDVCCHVYETGCIIACGSPIEVHQLLAMYKVMNRIKQAYPHWQLVLTRYSVSNVVASMALGYLLDVARFHRDHSDRSRYEPADFPGLFYMPNGADNARPLVIIHTSGAVVVVSAKSLDHARETITSTNWGKYKIEQK